MHAPGHLREAFLEIAETGEVDSSLWWGRPPADPEAYVLGRLWHCTDIMPVCDCYAFGLQQGSTYAQAVQGIVFGRIPWPHQQRLRIVI
jgi:hypothetical protein